ncbi:MAG: S4 domain-containing protein, partial [Coriobacteriaceae bacterium]|nr:S4 domain-containing protein [Coriobacteriaceae bacterium]
MSGRLDNELVIRGLLPTRSKAHGAIVAGQVLCDGEICTKPARKVDDTTAIELTGRVMPYVSRGGLKLEKALE